MAGAKKVDDGGEHYKNVKAWDVGVIKINREICATGVAICNNNDPAEFIVVKGRLLLMDNLRKYCKRTSYHKRLSFSAHEPVFSNPYGLELSHKLVISKRVK